MHAANRRIILHFAAKLSVERPTVARVEHQRRPRVRAEPGDFVAFDDAADGRVGFADVGRRAARTRCSVAASSGFLSTMATRRPRSRLPRPSRSPVAQTCRPCGSIPSPAAARSRQTHAPWRESRDRRSPQRSSCPAGRSSHTAPRCRRHSRRAAPASRGPRATPGPSRARCDPGSFRCESISRGW